MPQLEEDSYIKQFKKGDIIFTQGEIGDCAYIIEEGFVDIFLDMPDGSRELLSSRGPGAMIGEMALIDHEKRSASVQAQTDCRVMEIHEEEFHRRLNNTDPIIQMAMKVILLRYRDTLARVGMLTETGVYPTVEDAERKNDHSQHVIQSIKIMNELKEALVKGELCLHYQPINEISTGRILGFEALIRWQHPERGLIPPNDFIPLAEESGFIIELTKWTLRQACDDLAKIERALNISHLYMSVNFTAKDLSEENFISQLYKILSVTDTQPEKVQIEITERMLMEKPEQSQKTLQLCSDAGLRIAIDDFGTGYSSLSYLHHFPIDCLKIDRSFISKMCHNKGSLSLVQSIINLAKNLEMSVTAEGIEEIEEVELLKQINCEYGQGYHYSRPQPLQDIINTIIEKNMLTGSTSTDNQ